MNLVTYEQRCDYEFVSNKKEREGERERERGGLCIYSVRYSKCNEKTNAYVCTSENLPEAVNII